MLFIVGNVPHKSVGELPSHNHEATINTTNINGQIGSVVIRSGSTATGALNLVQKTYAKGLQDGSSWESWNVSLNAAHSHVVTVDNTGNNQAHNNMQPYITCYMWQRIE